MTALRRIFVFLVLASLATLVPLAAAAEETEQVHKVVPLAAGGALKVHNFSGRIRITGADVAQVTVDATRRGTRDRLDHIKLDIQASGSTVTIEANKKDSGWSWFNNNVVETDMEIQVPRRTDLEVDAFSSSITVAGVAGRQDVHAFSGDVRVDDATGPLRAKTFSGEIQVSLAPSATEPDLNLHTFSGAIDVRVPQNARAALDFSSFSGDLTSDFPLTVHEKSRRHMRAALNAQGDGAHPVLLKTFSGDVRIRK